MALRTLLITLTAAALLTACAGASATSATSATPAGQPVSTALSNNPALVPYEGRTPSEIYEMVRDTTRASGTVHVRMESKNADATLTANMRIGTDGTAKGWVAPIDGQKVQLLRVGDRAWFKADAAFLEARGLNRVAPDGDWTPVTRKGQMTSYLTYTEMSFYTDDLLGLPDGEVFGMRQVDGRKLEGQLSVGLQPQSGSVKVFASADGSGALVGYQKDEITYVFSDWDKPFKIQAPS